MKSRISTALILIFLGSLLCSFVFAVTPMIVSVNDFIGRSGGTVEAVIEVESADNIGSMDLSLEYDPQILVIVDVLQGFLTRDSIVEYSPDDGFVRILINDVDGFSGSGSILSVQFTVTGTNGDSCELVLMDVEANDASSFVDKIIESVSGFFQVEEVVLGLISCSVSPTSVHVEEEVVFSGSITPVLEDVEIIISLTDPNDGVHEFSTRTDASGSYSSEYSPKVEGDWTATASWKDSVNTVSSSSTGFTVEATQSGGIPGYSLESIILGVMISVAVFWYTSLLHARAT
jgi:hypothetical protein